MAFKSSLTLLMSAIIIACNPGGKGHPSKDDVPGIYINTYSVDVIDPETGETMGSREVRDTIFVKAEGADFEVKNRKWLRNDYDNAGWVDSMQGEIEPMKTYRAQYDRETGTLWPAAADNDIDRPPLFLEDKKIHWGELRALEYLKVGDSTK